MGFNWYLNALKHYFDFKGRARRREYWFFMLYNVIFLLIALSLDNVLGWANPVYHFGPLYNIYGLLLLIPNLSIIVRRLHDTDRRGFWILLVFIPVIGSIWILVLMLLNSKPGENKYGPNPKGI
ncbi:MAG: DUF805 domain-containing protein [Paludibacter sp.]|nr:DUF805 domain-containing protein [Paludibacter sp.]